jgi:hypothetical protein
MTATIVEPKDGRDRADHSTSGNGPVAGERTETDSGESTCGTGPTSYASSVQRGAVVAKMAKDELQTAKMAKEEAERAHNLRDSAASSTSDVVSVSVAGHFRAAGNRREHWRARIRRVARERYLVSSALGKYKAPALPVTVELRSVRWNLADVDNLVSGMKTPIDAVAEWLMVDDRDRRVFWRLSQVCDRAIPRVAKVVRGHVTFIRSAEVRITVRQWLPSDGEAALVVATAPLPQRKRSPKPKGNAHE